MDDLRLAEAGPDFRDWAGAESWRRVQRHPTAAQVGLCSGRGNLELACRLAFLGWDRDPLGCRRAAGSGPRADM